MMIKRIQPVIERYSAYVFGLPAYFCLHQYLQYQGLLTAATAVHAALTLTASFVILFMIIYRITGHPQRTALMVTLLGTVLLFFGSVKDALAQLPWPWLSRYRILMPALFLMLIFGVARINTQLHFRKITLYLNLLLLLFFCWDGLSLLQNQSAFFWKRNLLVKQDRLHSDSYSAVSQKPDIYYLVFDSYPGTDFLRKFHQFDNQGLKVGLTSRGFHIIDHSISNYNRTVFSIASTLNAEYLRTIQSGKTPEPKVYNQARLSVEKSVIPVFLQKQGYLFYNLSVFPINGTTPIYSENFLTLPEMQVMMYNTLPFRLRKDILWHFLTGQWSIPIFHKIYRFGEQNQIQQEKKKRDFNNRCIDSLMKVAATPTTPKFIYSHLYLPHPPYFYTEKGNTQQLEQVSQPEAIDSKPLFLSYLKYTNTIILKLTDLIQRHSSGPCVIILQSDHGLRDFAEYPQYPKYGYENFSAFYFSDKDYASLYDSMSNINTFPVLLNKYFHTSLPMLPDTVVHLPVYQAE